MSTLNHALLLVVPRPSLPPRRPTLPKPNLPRPSLPRPTLLRPSLPVVWPRQDSEISDSPFDQAVSVHKKPIFLSSAYLICSWIRLHFCSLPPRIFVDFRACSSGLPLNLKRNASLYRGDIFACISSTNVHSLLHASLHRRMYQRHAVVEWPIFILDTSRTSARLLRSSRFQVLLICRHISSL